MIYGTIFLWLGLWLGLGLGLGLALGSLLIFMSEYSAKRVILSTLFP